MLTRIVNEPARCLGLLTALALATVLLCGCASAPGFDVAAPTATHRTVSIEIYTNNYAPEGWSCTSKGKYTICLSEDPIDLSHDPDPVLITWSLAAQGWSFVRNKGIKITGGGWHETEVSGTQYNAWNRKDRQAHKYEINVVNANGDPVTWDPFIWNN